jgi:molybdenum cofactor guanylyltransferase
MIIWGVVLAGGRSSRMGGNNKALMTLAGRRLLDRVLERFAPQVSDVLINANDRLVGIPHMIVPDIKPDFPGPLTGLVSVLDWLERENIAFGGVAIVPCDGPFLPTGLVSTLASALDDSNVDVACIRYNGEIQPTFSVWRRSTIAQARASLQQQGGLKKLMSELNTCYVDWPVSSPSPFFNINTPQDLALAASLLELPA